jgi:endogenous inhibitor of DNA gyrase (YacG/DUF329 family)
MKTIICEVCGNSKRTQTNNVGRFCSMKCKSAAAERVERICPGCDKHESVLKSQNIGRKYCSEICRIEHKRRGRMRVCGGCGNEFEASSLAQRFCSIQCRATHLPSAALVDGRSRHPQYERWYNMVQRCTNPQHTQWEDYGGRGITVHDDWITDPFSFYRYVDDTLGPCPARHSIDRIDNDKGYEPGNIRWATHQEQVRNRRPYLAYHGPPNQRPLRLTHPEPNVWVIS